MVTVDKVRKTRLPNSKYQRSGARYALMIILLLIVWGPVFALTYGR